MKNFKNNWIILALVPVVVLLANTTVMANEVSRVTVRSWCINRCYYW